MNHTLLGFDYGRLRIGVAVGQTITGQARPLETLRCPNAGQPDWSGVERLLREWAPAALVVGRPCHADGSDSAITAAAERFARQLEGRFGLGVHLVDERLSSVEAEQRLAQSGGNNGGARRGGKSKSIRNSKEAVDMMAACVILETWLADTHP